jgi:CheY-like chemotaxis protein
MAWQPGASEPDGLDAPRAGPPRIAVAEDDPDMRSLVAEALRDEGYEVVEIANGAELLVLVTSPYREGPRAERIDLVITDVRMPVISGLAIVRGLREAHRLTPVIVMTAFGDAATGREVAALGAVLLDKPLRLSTLCDEVAKLLHAEDGRGTH